MLGPHICEGCFEGVGRQAWHIGRLWALMRLRKGWVGQGRQLMVEEIVCFKRGYVCPGLN
jgi:hypothetical protein